jgi:hypothetical protein
MTKFSNDKRHLPFGHSTAVNDPKVLAVLESFRPNLVEVLSDTSVVDKFCDEYKHWILTSSNHKLQGLDEFKYSTYSLGTSEAFDKFYIRNKDRRFRCFSTEYMYHQLAWRNSWPNWKFIEDDLLRSEDAVVISLPFADTGDKHHLHDEVLSQCAKIGIPVLIDFCYFSISDNIVIELTHPCITDVVFSLSKVFPVAHARIGMRLTRVDDDDTMFVYQKSSYNNRVGASLGLELIRNFSCDYIPNTYRKKQIEFCDALGIVPSKTVIFGIATSDWKEYNRGGLTNRLSLHKFLDKDINIIKEVLNGSSIEQ